MISARMFRTAAFAVAAGVGLVLFDSFAPLQGPSVMVYGGCAVVLTGLAGCVLPGRWTGLSKRVFGLAVALGGVVVLTAGLYWPATLLRAGEPSSRLDAFLPEYHFYERHEMRIPAAPDRVFAALRQVTFDDIGVMRTLGSIRNIAMGARVQAGQNPLAGMPVIEIMSKGRTGFFPLDAGERELVFGMAGQPWNNAAVRLKPDEFRGWLPAGNVKIAFNFAAQDLGNGWSLVTTETRVQATDDAARRKMAKYWRLIYPGSGMIRRSMLQAVRHRVGQ